MQVITDDISLYDKSWWEKFYSVHTHSYNEEELAAFKAAKDYIGDKEVIDVGCGEGFFSQFIDPKKYLGIDWSEQAIKKAKELRPDRFFMSGNIEDIVTDNWSFALLSMVFEHIEDPKDYIKRIKKKAKKVVVIIPNGHTGKQCVDNDKPLIRQFSEHVDYHYATYDKADIIEMFPKAEFLFSSSTTLVFVI